jgi:hypothetical protein
MSMPLLLRNERVKMLSARVAQSVERSAVNRKVGGSNPPVSDIFYYNHQMHKKYQKWLNPDRFRLPFPTLHPGRYPQCRFFTKILHSQNLYIRDRTVPSCEKEYIDAFEEGDGLIPLASIVVFDGIVPRYVELLII